MSTIIDRRLNDRRKQLANRERFMRRSVFVPRSDHRDEARARRIR